MLLMKSHTCSTVILVFLIALVLNLSITTHENPSLLYSVGGRINSTGHSDEQEERIGGLSFWLRKLTNGIKRLFGVRRKVRNFDCGKSDILPKLNGQTPRIFGGTKSKLHSWPWVTSVVSMKTLKTCGGSLIAPDTVLTAAHCVVNEIPKNLRIAAGVHTILGKMNPINYYKVSKVIIYDKYRFPTFGDVALIKIDERLNRTDKINTICLPLKPYRLTDMDAVISGWGVQSSVSRWFSSGSLVLKQGQVAIQPDSVCHDHCSDYDPDDELCAYNVQENVDARSGDSGGPLMIYDKEWDGGRWVLVAVTSHGSDDAPVRPGFYSRVFEKINFINEYL